MRDGNLIYKPANGTLGLSEVAGLLGVSRRSDGHYYASDVFNSPALNVWSRVKPIRSSKPANITPSDRGSACFGFNLASIQDGGIVAQSMLDCLNKAKAMAGAWEYLRPRGRAYNERRRLLDLNGYNHVAPAPYSMVYDSRIISLGYKSIRIDDNGNAEITVTDIPSTAFSSLDPETAYMFLLFRKRGGSVQYRQSSDPISDIFPLYSQYTFTQIPITSNGVYEFCVAISNYEGGSSDDWLYLPGTYGEIVANDRGFILDMEFDIDGEDDPFSVSVNSQNRLTVRQQFLMTNNIEEGVDASSIEVTSTLYYEDGGDYIQLATIPGSEVEDLIYGDTSDDVPMSFFNIDTDLVSGDPYEDIYIETFYTYKENGTGPTITRYFDYLNNQSTGSHPGYPSLQQVLDSF